MQDETGDGFPADNSCGSLLTAASARHRLKMIDLAGNSD